MAWDREYFSSSSNYRLQDGYDLLKKDIIQILKEKKEGVLYFIG